MKLFNIKKPEDEDSSWHAKVCISTFVFLLIAFFIFYNVVKSGYLEDVSGASSNEDELICQRGDNLDNFPITKIKIGDTLIQDGFKVDVNEKYIEVGPEKDIEGISISHEILLPIAPNTFNQIYEIWVWAYNSNLVVKADNDKCTKFEVLLGTLQN